MKVFGSQGGLLKLKTYLFHQIYCEAMCFDSRGLFTIPISIFLCFFSFFFFGWKNPSGIPWENEKLTRRYETNEVKSKRETVEIRVGEKLSQDLHLIAWNIA